MIKAFKYTRHYCEGVRGFNQTEEVFIPAPYNIAVWSIGGIIYAEPADGPRAEPPMLVIPNENVSSETIEQVKQLVPERFRNMETQIDEIEISKTDADRFMEMAKRIQAYKYTRHYCIDFVHGEYGQTEEIFIPEYEIAFGLVDGIMYATSIDKPRTGSPISVTRNDTLEEMDSLIPEKFRNINPQVMEITVTREDADRFMMLARLTEQQKTLAQSLQLTAKKYLN